MTTTQTQAIAEQNSTEVPLYTLRDVAHYLRVPVLLARALSGQRDFPVKIDWLHLRLFAHTDEFRRAEGEHRFSFKVFAELYVRAVAMHCLAEQVNVTTLRRGELASFQEAEGRIIYGNEYYAYQHIQIFEREKPAIEAVTQFLNVNAVRLPEAVQSRLQKRLLLCLERIELLDGQPSRLFPFSRVPPEGSPRTIVMDPRIRFGRPTLSGRGIPTDILFERHQAGDSIADLSQDYDLTADEVEEAIRYETMPIVPLFLPLDW